MMKLGHFEKYLLCIYFLGFLSLLLLLVKGIIIIIEKITL